MACQAQGLWCSAYGNGQVAIRLLQHLSLDTPVMQPDVPLPEEIIFAAPASFLKVYSPAKRQQRKKHKISFGHTPSTMLEMCG